MPAAPRGAARALLGSLLRPHARRIGVAVAVLLIRQAAQQAGPLLVAYAFDRAVPALRAHHAGPLVSIAAGYLLCAAVSGAAQYRFVTASARVGQDVLADLRDRIFVHAQRLDLAFHEKYTSGRLTARATSDVEALRELLDGSIEQIVTAGLSTVTITATLLYLDWPLGAAALAVIVPLYATMRSFRHRSASVYTRRSEALATVTTKTAETFAGIRAVQALRHERANDTAFAELNGHHKHLNGTAGLEMARYVTASRLVANIAVAALVLWGAYRVATGGVELGIFAAVVLSLRRLYDEPLKLGGVLDAYQSASASLRAIATILTRQPTVNEPTHPTRLPAQPAGRQGRTVLFEQVSFAYHTGTTVLPCLNLAIPAGQTVAVIGATGSGKSTLVKLLARLYDPIGGRIVLDGVNLRDLPTNELHSTVVLMPQEAFLFTATVADNIALGHPGVSRSDIEAAATAVGAHRFITDLPDGYDTRLTGGSGRLSAGQRQLIALARVLIANPSVVILDEATSSLDIPTERLIHDAMRTVLAGRTAVIIAHRLSTIRIAGRILVMSDGHIIEDGASEQLLATPGRFAQLHQVWHTGNG
ncbi:ABC transporter ATP-binding protein [Dactylosporangium sp. NPDC051484]|uniref:ABC transporter ATP-binding protein n=1 Tax=Dactylosporangium sp. NPDC051484 TaxID=3154942 RepID=UPI00344BD47B